MKGIILTDVHGHFVELRNIIESENPDYVWILGDLCNQEKGERRLDVGDYPEWLTKNHHWFYGNHENLKVKPPGDCLGFFGTRTIDGIKFTAIGGIAGKNRLVHWGQNGALDQIKQVEYTNILLSHETCSPFLHAKRHNHPDVGNKELAEQCARLKPRLHFSGHHHHTDVATINGVLHYRLPYAWKGYAILKDGNVEVVTL